MPAYAETFFQLTADGTALTASVTPTSLLTSTAVAKATLPANYFSRVGMQMRFRASGRITTVVTPGTLTLDLRLGSVVIANGGAMALNATAKTNVTWHLDWLLTLRAIGNTTAANFMHTGRWLSEAVIGSALPSAGGTGELILPSSAPAVGTGFDSSAAQTFDFFATWGTSNANSIQIHQAIAEAIY